MSILEKHEPDRFRQIVLTSLLFVFMPLVYLSAQETGAPYLIITHDNYYNALLPLAEWKKQKGMKTKIARLSEIGSDSAQIRNYVRNAYLTWVTKPQYLLLVGNHFQIPYRQFNYNGHAVRSDNYYTNVVGDFQNELIPGRFWVDDSFEAQTVVAKVLAYEKNPEILDPLWFKRGVTIVNEDSDWPPGSDSVYWADARYAHNYMFHAGFAHIDSFSKFRGHDTSDVVNVVNTGCSYILYRGLAGGYWDYPFFMYHLTPLNNGFKLPIIISATCYTVEPMGRRWLTEGSPAFPKGVVGFVGSSTAFMGGMGGAERRSALTKGTLDGIFSNGLNRFGWVVERGRLKYLELFDDTLEYYAWTCLGDPEMNLLTDTPRQLTVNHYPEVWIPGTLTVKVEYQSMPVESAYVCIMAKNDSTLYHTRFTDQDGLVRIVDTLYYPDSAFITVTGKNLKATFDTVMGISIGGPLVLYYRHEIIDTANGNGNYQANNGETIDISVWALNGGDSTAQSVTGILHKAETDMYYQLNDSVKYFGDIVPADSAYTSPDGFDIIIDQYCPDSHLIKLKLECTDICDSTWTSFFALYVSSPRPYIVYKSHLIFDSLGGNGNSEVNPGEDIELPVWVQNIGDSLAENVYGILRKQNPGDWWFSLYDTLKIFGDVAPGDSSWTNSNSYNVVVDSQCGDYYAINLEIALQDSLDSLWTYAFTLINHSPRLLIEEYFVQDSLKYFDQGDTASFVIFIRNEGSTAAENAQGVLTCTDTLITILDSFALFGTILTDSTGSNQSDPFMIATDPSVPPGYVTDVQLNIKAGGYDTTFTIEIYIGQKDYLVWDPDPNHTSGFLIHTRLNQLGFSGEYKQTCLSEFFNVYKAIFICCGMAPPKYVILDTSGIGQDIEYHIARGGKAYIEGGDVWYYDPLYADGFDFCSLFCITPLSHSVGYFDGAGGVDGTFTQGMSFDYSGESNFIDRIDPVGTGIQIFTNRFNDFGIGVAANNHTVGISIELNGLVDATPPSTKTILLDSIMHYFGIEPYGIGETSIQNDITSFSFNIYPNPSFGKIKIKYQIPSVEQDFQGENSITIYDIMGRLVKTFSNLPVKLNNTMVWDCRDDLGRKVPQGVYFITYDIQNHKNNLKVVFLR